MEGSQVNWDDPDIYGDNYVTGYQAWQAKQPSQPEPDVDYIYCIADLSKARLVWVRELVQRGFYNEGI